MALMFKAGMPNEIKAEIARHMGVSTSAISTALAAT
jgi:hypothetical protein